MSHWSISALLPSSQGSSCCWRWSVAAWFPGELGLRDYFTKCVDLGWFLHQAVLVAAVGNSCHCSHVEGGGSSAEADAADGFHGLGWQFGFLWISWDPALVLSSPWLKVQALQLNYFGLGPSGFHIPSFLCGIQMSLAPWQELEANRKRYSWPCCQQLRTHVSKQAGAYLPALMQYLEFYQSGRAKLRWVNVTLLPGLQLSRFLIFLSCCSANTALILCSLHTLLPAHTFCTPGCSGVPNSLLSRASSVPQAAVFIAVQSHQAKPACKPCQCLPSFYSRKDFNPFSPSR